MMDDREFDELVETMKSGHNQPPETPRDRMWERIDASRSERRPGKGKIAGILTPRVWRLTAAAAAVLVLGIAIGRMVPRDNVPMGPLVENTAPTAPLLATTDPRTGDLLYRKAAADLFGRADILLTDFKVTPCADQDLEAVPDWAGGMLLQTRLLMGSPVAQDQNMHDLLLDLELVLAQIVGINKDNCARDVAWIRDAIEEKSTIDRLRVMRPASATHDAI